MNAALIERTETDSCLFGSRSTSYGVNAFLDSGDSSVVFYSEHDHEVAAASLIAAFFRGGRSSTLQNNDSKRIFKSDFFEETLNSLTYLIDNRSLNFISSDVGSSNRDAFLVYNEKLGEHCAERLALLLKCSKGWDGEEAEPLSYKSLLLSLQLLNKMNLKKQGENATVFMGFDGCVSLAWPTDNHRNMIEIFFRPDEINVYTDIDDEDMFFESVNEDLVRHIERYL